MILRIECPQCRQSFEVGEELKGRTVECGSCENRFQVTEEVTALNRDRFYPDEIRKNADLSRFGKATTASAPVEFRTMEYEATAKSDFVGPVAPVRTFATVFGLLLFLICALAFYFGSLPGGSLLKDVEKLERYQIAGFFGLVGFVLVVWGMLRKRIPGILLGLVGLAGLLALAHFLPVHRTPVFVSGDGGEDDSSVTSEGDGSKSNTFFPGITDEEPLRPDEVMKMTRWKSTVFPEVSEWDEARVAAVWVREMAEFHSLEIEKYLQQELQLPSQPYFRTLSVRGKVLDGGIFVMSGVPLDLDRVEAAAERLGEVEQVIPELRVVQLRLNVELLGGDASNNLNSKLIDPTNGAFYSLNHKELLALDRGRVKAAVRRLANVKQPLQMRKDITVRLVGLLGQESEPEMVGLLAEAIRVWSEEGDGADLVLMNQIVKMRAGGKTVPDEMMRFLAERKTASAANLMVSLWSLDPSGRQRFLVTYGSQVAPAMVPYLKNSNSALSRSAVRVLGQIGTRSQLPEMREVLGSSEDEALKVSLKQAIEQVERR